MAAPQNYADLQAQVGRWSGGLSDDFYAEAVRDSIGLAENDLDQLLWVAERVKRVTRSYTTEFSALPADFARMIHLRRLNTDGSETSMIPQSVEALPGIKLSYAGPPFCYAEVGAQLQLVPPPTTTTPMQGRLIYYGLVPRLSDAASCTAVLTTYGNVYLYTALKHLATYAEDETGVAKWGALSVDAIASANRLAVLRGGAVE